MWHIRVHSALAPAKGPLNYKLLMELYSAVGKEGSSGWHPDKVLVLDDRTSQYLTLFHSKMCTDGPQPWPAVKDLRGPVVALATDAYPRGLGYVIYGPGGHAWASQHRPIPETDQVVAEAMAVARACQELSGYLRHTPDVRVVVAVDADTVRAIINKGYSRTERLREQLRKVFQCAPDILAVRVSGEDNAADAPSRGRPLEPEHVAATWGVLRGAVGARAVAAPVGMGRWWRALPETFD